MNDGTWPLFRNCLLASFAIHAALLLGLRFWRPWPGAVEIDLTHTSFLGTGPAKLGAPKPKVSGAKKAPIAPAPPKPRPKPLPETSSIAKPKPLVRPKPIPQAPPAPEKASGGAARGTGNSPLKGGSGKGAEYGKPHGLGNGGADLLRLPELLNRAEIMAGLRRFYPEKERRAGREAQVLLNLHIGADGSVSRVDVVSPAASDFNQAAVKVARLMRFKPALSRGGPVPVVIRQMMVFRLEN